jgi:Domain of unknown function (DUF3331)
LCTRTKGTHHETSIDHVPESAVRPIRVCFMCRDSTRPPNDTLRQSSGCAGHDVCQGDVMTALFCNDPWLEVLSNLLMTSRPDACCSETKSIKHGSQGRGSAKRVTASWLPATSPNDESVGLLPKLACVTILERRSPITIAVRWCDATSGHYGDPVWTAGVAQKRALCALTGAHIRRGEIVYRPRRSRAHQPANLDRMILASTLPECDAAAAVEQGRLRTSAVHVTPGQPPESSAARQNAGGIQR